MVCAATLQYLALHSRHSWFHHLRPILFRIYHSWTNPGFFMSWNLWGLYCNWTVTYLQKKLSISSFRPSDSTMWETLTHYLPSSSAYLMYSLGHLGLQLLSVDPKEILPRVFHPNCDEFFFIKHCWLFSALAYLEPQSPIPKYHVSLPSKIFAFLWNIHDWLKLGKYNKPFHVQNLKIATHGNMVLLFLETLCLKRHC